MQHLVVTYSASAGASQQNPQPVFPLHHRLLYLKIHKKYLLTHTRAYIRPVPFGPVIVVFAGVDVFLPCGGVVCGVLLCVEAGEAGDGVVCGELLCVEVGDDGIPEKTTL